MIKGDFMTDLEKLQKEIEDLKLQLGVEKEQRTAAEEMAHAMSEASAYSGSNVEEQATGKTRSIEVCTNPWERDTKKHKYKTVKMPTYYYTIQLPPAAGLALSTNGIEYYHGETYEFVQQELAEMKSRVARCWDHEKSIHGDNENAYRKPTHKVLGVKK
jgi:hypothetical protein